MQMGVDLRGLITLGDLQTSIRHAQQMRSSASRRR